MSQRQRAGRRPASQVDRARFLAVVAAETGQTVERVAEDIRQAVKLGWLVETPDGWQAALPVAVADPDWTGPVT
jgi:hypothetical protein